MSNRHRWIPWLRSHESPADTGALEAVKDAQQGLSQAKAEQARAQQLARDLRAIRQKNHFSEAIAAAYRGEHP
ncbi:hypothetical protein [Micrococcus sp. IITD107]|uniref:DUF7620 family protein n=1 Tax=Micrococcus sp. IITD107 TaxID=3342790 RepID=UPI0035BA22B5